MQKKLLFVIIVCMMFTLCGCGITKFFQKNTTKNDIVYEQEKDTQYEVATETVLGTEVVLSTELETEVGETTEVVGETENEEDTETTTQTKNASNVQTEEKSKSQTKTDEGNKNPETLNSEIAKQETPKEESVKEETTKEETSKQETPKEETSKQEAPKEETPKEEPVVSESESETTSPARGAYLVKGQDLSNASLSVGDGMYDITVTTVDGEKVTLSELLQEKDMVMLNFWYISCYWCDYEFPYMASAYNNYNEDVEIIALNWYDNQASIVEYKTNEQLPFKVAQCAWSWANAFGINGYPTSIIIDRYGMICAIEPGAMTSEEEFNSVFERYIGDDYQPAY